MSPNYFGALATITFFYDSSKPILKLGVQLYGMLIVTTNEKCKLVNKEISFRI